MTGPFEDKDPARALERSISRSSVLFMRLLDQVARACLDEMKSPLPDSAPEVLRGCFVLRARPEPDGRVDVTFSSRRPVGVLVSSLDSRSMSMDWPLSGLNSRPATRYNPFPSDKPAPEVVKDRILVALFGADDFSIDLSDKIVEEMIKLVPVLEKGTSLVRDIGICAEDIAYRHVKRALRFEGSEPELERLYKEAVAACVAISDEERASVVEADARSKARSCLEKAMESALLLLTEEEISGIVDLARIRSVMES